MNNKTPKNQQPSGLIFSLYRAPEEKDIQHLNFKEQFVIKQVNKRPGNKCEGPEREDRRE